MIIGVSGSQGQGKSTILSSLSEMGYNVINIKTSRSILNEWGLTLNDVNKYAELTHKFQEKIIDKHYSLISKYINDEKIYFMERTFADIFTYCLLALGSYNEYNEWMNEYYNRCVEKQSQIAKIFYISGRENMKMENDGVRSVNKHFVNIVDNRINHYLKKMENDAKLKSQVEFIVEADHEKRLELIINNLE